MGAEGVYKKKESGSNDRLYNWYFTQAGTEYWNINCGPACLMAMKWADRL